MGAKLFDCGEHNAEDERIEPSPGWIIDPRLKRTERNAAVDRRILPGEKRAQCDPAENDNAWNDDRSTRPAIHEEQDEGKTKIELVFDRQRPCMRERGPAVKRNVLDRQKKFPERLRHVGILAPRRQQKVNRQNGKISRHDPQDATSEEAPKFDRFLACERSEQLPADQVTAEDEEKIDTDPAEAINAAGQFESEKRRVINDDNNDGEGTEKIETRLTFAILKARVDRSFGYGVVNGANVAGD